MEQEWKVRPLAPREHFARFHAWPPLVAQVLYNRGFTDQNEAQHFITHQIGNTNPFNLKDMLPAVTRIRHALAQGERIAVHGDFDADGITATALMVETLHTLGADVAPYIPTRVDEGYGLNRDALDRIAAKNVRLVVTVDCGIRALDEIAHACEQGLDIIVTDHHALADTLPKALAIVNPKQSDERYNFKDFSGVGLAYKMAQALVLAHQKNPVGTPRAPLDLNDLLDLVALGTVADMVPLTGENRALVAAGLTQLNTTTRPGLQALLAQANVRPGEIDAQAIAFRLAPRINAAGRLDKAMLAYKLLLTRDPAEAAVLAASLEALNSERRAMTEQAVAHARTLLPSLEAPLLFLADDSFAEGIIGLVAGKLQEHHNRPTIVVRRGPPDGESRGSARSIPGFHITEALDQCADLLVKHGGHAAAAGFTIHTRLLGELEARLRQLASHTYPAPPPLPALEADAEVRLEKINDEVLASLETLAPFGQGNPEPRFLIRGLQVRDAQRRNGNTLTLKLADAQRRVWKAVAFRQGHLLTDGPLPSVIDVFGHFQYEYWRGTPELKIHVAALRPGSET